jgi:hypothetical protein
MGINHSVERYFGTGMVYEIYLKLTVKEQHVLDIYSTNTSSTMVSGTELSIVLVSLG